jgi:hypothetical protein
MNIKAAAAQAMFPRDASATPGVNTPTAWDLGGPQHSNPHHTFGPSKRRDIGGHPQHGGFGGFRGVISKTRDL